MKGGSKMERMSDYEWFCANCLRMVDTLSRHGRCPYCDSNAVDVAYRWNRREMTRESQEVSMTPELVGAQQ
jgi:rRNA maturation endonuclease Nob1